MNHSRTQLAGILRSQNVNDAHCDALAAILERAGIDPTLFHVDAVEIAGRVHAVVTITALWAMAARSSHLLPGHAPELRFAADGKLERVTAFVRTLAGGTWHEVGAIVLVGDVSCSCDEGAIDVAQARAIRSVLAIETAGLLLADELIDASAVVTVTADRINETRAPAPRADGCDFGYGSAGGETAVGGIERKGSES